MKIETGMLDDRFPYVLAGKGERLAVVFPGSEDLLVSAKKHAWLFGPMYARLFPKDFRVLILGYEPIPPGKTPLDVANDFQKALKNRYKPDVVLGLSYGGLVAMAFGVVHGRRTRSLIIASAAHAMSTGGEETAIRWKEIMRAGQAKKLFIDFCSLFKRRRYRLLARLTFTAGWFVLKRRINPGSTLVNAYDAALGIKDKARELFTALRPPTLVLSGTDDQLFPVEACKDLVSIAPRATLELVEGETHTMLFENSKECARRVKMFLSSVLE